MEAASFVTGSIYKKFHEAGQEVFEECVPKNPSKDQVNKLKTDVWQYIHIPYFPAFHRPGWLLRYMVGPYDKSYFESFFADIWAGITVALTLIPQALSYAGLAQQPAQNGLYAAILPSATYTFFGSSMQLAVGPVAIVSLLMGQIVIRKGIDYTTDPIAAMNIAAQASLCVGIILTAMSLLNLGTFINFISKPVMSGFTTGAAMLIGLSQLKDAFGFIPPVPQQGQEGYHLNYEVMTWYSENWYGSYPNHYKNAKYAGLSYQNPYAIQIFFGLYIPLMFFNLLKQNLTFTDEQKKTWSYTAFTIFNALLPLFCILIGGHVAWNIKAQGNYTTTITHHEQYAKLLKVVGTVPSGLNIIRKPTFLYPMGEFMLDVLPLTLIAFMESYSVARRIAGKRNELHILNASQEMWANGAANFLGAVSSSYPVSGSFSRSSLNYLAGAKTPLSKVTTLIVVLIALGSLSDTFYYIPRAALTAVIYAAIFNLIALDEIWEAWKHSKKDFFTMILTITVTFVFETSYGLAAGLLCSIIVFLGDIIIDNQYKPILEHYSCSNDGIAVVRVKSDLNFLTAARIKDFLSTLTTREPPVPESNASQSEYLFHAVSSAFDSVLIPSAKTSPFVKETMPWAIVIDLAEVKVVDISGLNALSEVLLETRDKKVKGVVINVDDVLLPQFVKFHIKNDVSNSHVNLDRYLAFSKLEKLPRNDKIPRNASTITNCGNGIVNGSSNDSHDDADIEAYHSDDAEDKERDSDSSSNNNNQGLQYIDSKQPQQQQQQPTRAQSVEYDRGQGNIYKV